MIEPPQNSAFDGFHSHSDKALRVHMSGVLQGTTKRSDSRVAEVAALFHDLGKLNPNFQPKVNPSFARPPQLESDYSRHAYLSAYAWLCFNAAGNKAAEMFGLEPMQMWSVTALIAHHHGHLPDFDAVLSKTECEQVLEFLSQQLPLPISPCLQEWQPHNSFDVVDARWRNLFAEKNFRGMTPEQRASIDNRLDYFLDTQFSFAALIEADKRDAGDNAYFRREDQMDWASKYFEPCLQARLDLLTQNAPQSTLNTVRTAIREESIENLRAQLQLGKRTFSLTSPTGSGKTFALLALAAAIRQSNPQHAVIYGLPFLTITEQVETVCREVWCQNKDFVTRFDSRAHNSRLEELLAELDGAPQEQDNQEGQALLQEAFSFETFDNAFTVTTFVQIFETLLSNRNATLLKLPNFAKTIFLLDEIQSLPPRLYVFFAAYLQAFCEKFDCYAIFSTATMPAFDLPEDPAKISAVQARALFPTYQAPPELLDFSKYFGEDVFDRYEIRPLQNSPITHEELATKIDVQSTSALVILNTIADSKTIYRLVRERSDAEVILLNTHFTLGDRQRKIARCQELLGRGERVILVSTQLIEAGVDIDFPSVFRDLCPLPSMIQSAGRCNRNGKIERGQVWFFELKGENGQSRAELIYRGEPPWFLNFSRDEILPSEGFTEKTLLPLQQKYFEKVRDDLYIGQHRLRVGEEWRGDSETTLVKYIDELAFATVGSFRLIDKKDFGEEFRYYVPQDGSDEAFAELEKIVYESIKAKRNAGGKLNFVQSKTWRLRIEGQLRAMAPRIVQFRTPYKTEPPVAAPLQFLRDPDREVCGLRCLSCLGDYSFETGVSFNGDATVIM